MQDVNAIGQSRRVNHAKSARVVPHANFFNTFANRGHGFDIIRLHASLNPIKLTAGILPRVARKLTQAFERVAEK